MPLNLPDVWGIKKDWSKQSESKPSNSKDKEFPKLTWMQVTRLMFQEIPIHKEDWTPFMKIAFRRFPISWKEASGIAPHGAFIYIKFDDGTIFAVDKVTGDCFDLSGDTWTDVDTGESK